MKVAILSLLASSLVSATPIKGTAKVAKFDNIDVTPGTGFVTPAPTHYQGLHLTGFGIETLTAGNTSVGVHPYSVPNDIFYAATTQELDGDPIISAVNGKPFSLQSMYFSCSADVGAARVPTDCTVIASAMSPSGVRRSTTFVFTASDEQQKATFPPQFHDIKQVSFTSPTSGVGTLPGTFTTSIDNIKYVLSK